MKIHHNMHDISPQNPKKHQEEQGRGHPHSKTVRKIHHNPFIYSHQPQLKWTEHEVHIPPFSPRIKEIYRQSDGLIIVLPPWFWTVMNCRPRLGKTCGISCGISWEFSWLLDLLNWDVLLLVLPWLGNNGNIYGKNMEQYLWFFLLVLHMSRIFMVLDGFVCYGFGIGMFPSLFGKRWNHTGKNMKQVMEYAHGSFRFFGMFFLHWCFHVFLNQGRTTRRSISTPKPEQTSSSTTTRMPTNCHMFFP